jgi:hypothetical protein
MVFYNKEINELREATNKYSSEVTKILLKFIEGISDNGINLSKMEHDKIKELTNKFWEKCTYKNKPPKKIRDIREGLLDFSV